MVLQLRTATHGIAARALAAGNVDPTNEAIDTFKRRVRLYEIALSRILDLPDGSVRLTEPGYVRTAMTAHRRGVNGDGLKGPYKARPRKSSV